GNQNVRCVQVSCHLDVRHRTGKYNVASFLKHTKSCPQFRMARPVSDQQESKPCGLDASRCSSQQILNRFSKNRNSMPVTKRSDETNHDIRFAISQSFPQFCAATFRPECF